MRIKTLCFTQITDSRFDNNILELLQNRIEKLKELLSIEGLEVNMTSPRLVDWSNTSENNIQYRSEFYITKNTRKISWNDIYKMVNSVKAVPYRFI